MVANVGRADHEIVPPEIDFAPMPSEGVQVFSLSDLIGQCAFEWSQRTRSKGLALVSYTGEFPRGRLHGQPQSLRQALDIMMHNAVRFTDSGSISLDCRAGTLDGNSLEIIVRVGDTGNGFAEDERHLLLCEPGLSRLDRIVSGMGGRFDIESTPGRGTMASFTLPLLHETDRNLMIDVGPSPMATGLAGLLSGRARAVAADAVVSAEALRSVPATISDSVPATAPGSRRARLLLVDDTRMNQTVISALLLRSGFRLDVVDSGAAALQATQTEAYDLILMDLRMPDMDGIETAQRIRSRGGPSSRIPIVALSADQEPETLTAAAAAGMNGFIAKPIDRNGLIDGVQTALDEATASARRKSV